jgi:hypothetical protein
MYISRSLFLSFDVIAMFNLHLLIVSFLCYIEEVAHGPFIITRFVSRICIVPCGFQLHPLRSIISPRLHTWQNNQPKIWNYVPSHTLQPLHLLIHQPLPIYHHPSTLTLNRGKQILEPRTIPSTLRHMLVYHVLTITRLRVEWTAGYEGNILSISGGAGGVVILSTSVFGRGYEAERKHRTGR